MGKKSLLTEATVVGHRNANKEYRILACITPPFNQMWSKGRHFTTAEQ